MTAAQAKTDTVTREMLDERTCRLMAIINAAKDIEQVRHEAIDAKLSAAKEVLEQRLHLLNDLRGNVVTKNEFAAQHSALIAEFHGEVKTFQTQFSNLNEWRSAQDGKASLSAVYIAYVIGIAGWLIGPLIAIAIEKLMANS